MKLKLSLFEATGGAPPLKAWNWRDRSALPPLRWENLPKIWIQGLQGKTNAATDILVMFPLVLKDLDLLKLFCLRKVWRFHQMQGHSKRYGNPEVAWQVTLRAVSIRSDWQLPVVLAPLRARLHALGASDVSVIMEVGPEARSGRCKIFAIWP